MSYQVHQLVKHSSDYVFPVLLLLFQQRVNWFGPSCICLRNLVCRIVHGLGALFCHRLAGTSTLALLVLGVKSLGKVKFGYLTEKALNSF
jgi:hypothetical protein